MSGTPLCYRLHFPSQRGSRNLRIVAYTEIPKTITHYTKSLYFINYQHFASVQCLSSHYTDTTPHYTHFASALPLWGRKQASCYNGINMQQLVSGSISVVWCSIRVVSEPTLHSYNHFIINNLQHIRVVCNRFRKKGIFQ